MWTTPCRCNSVHGVSNHDGSIRLNGSIKVLGLCERGMQSGTQGGGLPMSDCRVSNKTVGQIR